VALKLLSGAAFWPTEVAAVVAVVAFLAPTMRAMSLAHPIPSTAGGPQPHADAALLPSEMMTFNHCCFASVPTNVINQWHHPHAYKESFR
jgi:hypothetical protein